MKKDWFRPVSRRVKGGGLFCEKRFCTEPKNKIVDGLQIKIGFENS
jgi:hypothetical protein